MHVILCKCVHYSLIDFNEMYIKKLSPKVIYTTVDQLNSPIKLE